MSNNWISGVHCLALLAFWSLEPSVKFLLRSIQAEPQVKKYRCHVNIIYITAMWLTEITFDFNREWVGHYERVTEVGGVGSDEWWWWWSLFLSHLHSKLEDSALSDYTEITSGHLFLLNLTLEYNDNGDLGVLVQDYISILSFTGFGHHCMRWINVAREETVNTNRHDFMNVSRS